MRLDRFALLLLFAFFCSALALESTKASQSAYVQDITKATISEGLTNADLSWHAVHTFGWDCDEVTDKGPTLKEGYFVITCSSGSKLRVYLREGQHPKITNSKGTYSD